MTNEELLEKIGKLIDARLDAKLDEKLEPITKKLNGMQKSIDIIEAVTIEEHGKLEQRVTKLEQQLGRDKN